MDYQKRDEFISNMLTSAVQSTQFITKKLHEVSAQAMEATTETEQQKAVTDLRQLALMLAEASAHLEDAYSLRECADALPPVIDLDTLDMTAYRSETQRFEETSEALAMALKIEKTAAEPGSYRQLS